MICKAVFVVVISIYNTKCDWVEIPQTLISDTETLTKKTDFSSHIISTTFTTTRVPILSKPTSVKNKSNTKNKEFDFTFQNTTVQVPIFTTISANINKSMEVYKKKENCSDLINIGNQVFKNALETNDEVTNTLNKVQNNTNTKSYTNKSDNCINSKQSDKKNNTDFAKEEELGYSYANFIPYLSTVQSTLMKNAHKSERSKLNVLKHLRDHLLIEIENRISHLWNPKNEGRSARDYKDDSHVDFPSNEGALMTIGFLTFAVFLIKLVLQLIQNMTANNAGTTTTFIGRKRRQLIDEDEMVNILNYIEQFKL